MEARTLQATINEITVTQAKIAKPGAKAAVLIIDDKGSVLIQHFTFEEILGPAYDMICVTALDSIDVQLALAKTAAKKDLENIGVTNGE